MSGKIDLIIITSTKCIAQKNLASESCEFIPEQIYPHVDMHRDTMEFCA